MRILKRFRKLFLLSLVIKWLRRHHPGRRSSLDAIDQEFIDTLLEHDYTLSGETMEPMNLLFVGSRKAVERSFLNAGWFKGDRLGLYSLGRAFIAVVFDLPYKNAPFTPLFFNNRTQDFSLQKPTETNSARQRHHIRIWNTGKVLPDGRMIWIGSASFDDGVKLIPRPLFLTHKVHSDVDKERDYIVKELVAGGAKEGPAFSMLRSAAGKNAFGDEFATDGMIKVVEL
jgi:hypothetical protein